MAKSKPKKKESALVEIPIVGREPDRKQVTDRLSAYIDDPVECFQDLFGYYLLENEKTTGIAPDDYLDTWQKEAMCAVAERNYVAITGGNDVGKTTWLVAVLWWFYSTRHEAVGQCTSIDKTQLNHVLWAELRRWYNRSKDLKIAFDFHDSTFYHRNYKGTWWLLPRTARKQHDMNLRDGGEHSTGLQGIHAPHVIMAIDEGSGVEDPNWEAANSSIREEDNKLVAISNPLKVSGRMFEIFNLEVYRKYWYTRQVSYKECRRIDKKMAEEQIEMLGGIESPVVQIRYLGQFPKRGADDTRPSYDAVKGAMNRARQVDTEAIELLLGLAAKGIEIDCGYSKEQLEDYVTKFSYERETDFLPELLYSSTVDMPKPPRRWQDLVASYFTPPCRLGVDLARFGSSETVFAVRRNWRIVELRPRFHQDSTQIEATIKELYDYYRGMDLVLLDKTGLYGEAVADHLAISPNKIPCVAVGFGEDSIYSEEYKNEATEMWFEVDNNIDHMLLPYDLQLLTQFTTRTYGFTGKDQQKVIEPKDRMKKRHLPSPDRADAVGLAMKRAVVMTDDEEERRNSNEDYIDEPEVEGEFNL